MHKRVVSLTQNTMAMTLSENQVRNMKSEALRSTREMPQQLAIGLALHQTLRCKEMVNFLHGFGLCVEYNRILRVETQIENNVLQRMQENGGCFIPPDIVLGRQLLWAIDNSDFSEDTPDGKNTLHGTSVAVYQRKDDNDVKAELTFIQINIIYIVTLFPYIPYSMMKIKLYIYLYCIPRAASQNLSAHFENTT